MKLELDTIYFVEPRNSAAPRAAIVIKGDDVSVQILGSEDLPSSTADMLDLTDEGTLTENGVKTFFMLLNYICVSGTADRVDLVGYTAKKIEQ